jgi:acyl-coenzyme A thioesterase PaaI-like protein
MSYPPEHHVLRDLRFTTERPAADHAVIRAPLVPELRGPGGALLVGALTCLVDVTGAMIGLAAVTPDWVATADLSYHARGPVTEGPVVMTARPVRVGRNLVVVGCAIRDGRGADDPDAGVPAGVATMSFARIPGSASSLEPQDVAPPPGPPTRTSMALPGSGLRAPFRDAIGVRVLDPAAGVVELAKDDYVRNSFGTVNGGVVGAVFDAAAVACAGAAVGVPVDTVGLQVHYLAQTKAGPVRTSADLLRVDDRGATVRLELHDVSDGTLLALATVTTATTGA